MEIRYSITGIPRKNLVIALEDCTGMELHYEGAPSFAYTIGTYKVDREGTLTGPDDRALVDAFAAQGFQPPEAAYDAEPEAPTEPEDRTYKAELSDPDCPDRMEVFSATDDEDAVRQAREFCEGEGVLLELDELDDNYDVVRGVDLTQHPNGLAIEVPLTGFDPAKLDNLAKLVAGKETLIKMALGVDALPIRVLEDRISFPWFPYTEDGDIIRAYSQLISAICRTALEKQRVNAQPKEDYPNPKFTARCWCISLGLVGDEYRLIRKIMTSTLPGNGAWSKGADPRKAAAQEKAEAMADAELLFEVNKLLETGAAGEADLPGGGEEGADNA
jgi:hypothetical protein